MFVPFHILSDAVELILTKAATASEIDCQYYWDIYYNLIESCGWSDEDFDKEILNKVDNYWLSVSNKNVISIKFGI